MLVVVTGGAGFIGSHIVDALLGQGDQVHVLDDLSTGTSLNVDPRAEVHRLDVASESAGELVIRLKPDAVCHQAGIASVARSVADPFEDARVNLIGSLKLIVAAAQVAARFVFASSAAVYAEQNQLPISESTPTRPSSPYGAAKLAAEQYLAVYHTLRRMPATALRYANVYGPRQRSDGEGGVVAIFCAAGASGARLTVHGTGEQTRDFVHVTDVAEANVRALAAGSSGVFNVATGLQTSVLELANAVRNLASRPIVIVHGPERTGDLRRSALDPTLAAGSLGWRSRISLLAGLDQTYRWFDTIRDQPATVTGSPRRAVSAG